MRRIQKATWCTCGLVPLVLGITLIRQEPLDQDVVVPQGAYDLGLQQVAEGREPSAKRLTREEMDAVLPAARARLEKIKEEVLEPEAPDWAGRYYFGDQRDTNVSVWIAPRSGVYYSWDGCKGLYDINHGEVLEVRHDRILLNFEIDIRRSKTLHDLSSPRPILSREWLFVTWGDREYLIPSSSMISFCNGVNSGASHLLSGYPLKWEGAGGYPSPSFARVPDARPEVPEEYAPFLLPAPLSGRIVSAGAPLDDGLHDDGYRWLIVSATVDLGLQDGLLPGMCLFVVSEKGAGMGKVVAVEQATCTTEFRFREAWEPSDYAQVGWPVSTKNFKQRD